MFDNSIIKKTGQLWKVHVAFWSFLLGWVVMDVAIFFMDPCLQALDSITGGRHSSSHGLHCIPTCYHSMPGLPCSMGMGMENEGQKGKRRPT